MVGGRVHQRSPAKAAKEEEQEGVRFVPVGGEISVNVCLCPLSFYLGKLANNVLSCVNRVGNWARMTR
jgi:hypothetical protein